MYEKLTTESYLICSHVFLMIKVSPIKIMETFIFVKNKNCTNYGYAQYSKYISFSRQNSMQLQQSYLNTFSLLYDYSVPSKCHFFHPFTRKHLSVFWCLIFGPDSTQPCPTRRSRGGSLLIRRVVIRPRTSSNKSAGILKFKTLKLGTFPKKKGP